MGNPYGNRNPNPEYYPDNYEVVYYAPDGEWNDEDYYCGYDIEEMGSACRFIGQPNIKVFRNWADGTREEIIARRV